MTPRVLAAAVVLACALSGSALAESTLPKTGQKTCWSAAGARIGCTGTQQDGEQRAGLGIELRDSGNGTITDGNTRLVWEKLSRDGSIHDRGTLFTWEQASTAKVAQLNTPPCFAGLCTWRLPNVRELQSIADFDRKSPALAKAFLKKCTPGCSVDTCSCTQIPAAGSLAGFWSSTTNRSATAEAWQLVQATGAVASVAKTTPSSVRAVAEPVCVSAVLDVAVSFDTPGAAAAGVTVLVDYPTDLASIPGCCGDASVLARVSNETGIGNGLFSAGDSDSDGDTRDDQLAVGLISLDGIPAGPFAGITFDCPAGDAPLTTDFVCTLDASDANGDAIPGSCSVGIRYQ